MTNKIQRVADAELFALTPVQALHALVWMNAYIDESRKSVRISGVLYDQALRLAIEHATENH